MVYLIPKNNTSIRDVAIVGEIHYLGCTLFFNLS
ncbi:MAG: hypothetical protein ACD_55C00084G0002 [uncultured bacterium]|nr:MAG: hypothetical protein ACD_55C00084G0002 [uncultured bacterium]